MDRDADRAVNTLYRLHYRSLVSLTVLLVGEVCTAEGIVQDSFVAMHSAWPRLAEGDRALPYLHQSVIRRSRSVLRRRIFARLIAPGPPGAGPLAVSSPGDVSVLAALSALPLRQREVLVLLYYAALREAEVASALRISEGSVRRHAEQAISSLYGAIQHI
ncbi:MAG: sigma-70 family RNA polymerase sigma factor [Streptosporangiaceae bacterium]